jgi:DNA-binding MarR family transcriptional regulator
VKLYERARILKRTPAGAAIDALTVSIFRAHGRLLKAGDVFTRDLGLTSARWQVLGAIATTPKTVAQIARDFELSRQGVLWVVNSMVADGLVELIHNPDHRRAKLVRHTPKGAEAFDEVMKRQTKWFNELGQSFSVKQLEACREIIVKLSEAIKAHGEEAEE